jgi:acetylornithine deacetylase/succinyl-diaminopimelate desuccinylase-like protein
MRCNTLVPTLVQGRNTSQAEVLCDVRLLPGFDPTQLTLLLDGVAQKWRCTYSIERLSTGYHSPVGSFAGILERATADRLGAVGNKIRLLPFISMGSSDGHFLSPMHANVYGYNPVLSWDITFDTAVRMVHGVNERIHEDSVRFGALVLRDTLYQAACAQANLSFQQADHKKGEDTDD